MISDLEHSTNLQIQRVRLRNGYIVALVLLISAAVAALLILRHAQEKQSLIENLIISVGDTRLEIRESFSRATDLKDAAASEFASRRLIQKIEKKLDQNVLEIVELTSSIDTSIDELNSRGGSEQLSQIYHQPPHDLQQKLKDHVSRMERLKNDRDNSLSDRIAKWMPIDAVGAMAGSLINGLNEAHKQLVVESHNNRERLALTQTFAIGLIVGLLALSTVLIFLPLMRGLKRAHLSISAATKELEKKAYYDADTGLPNEYGIARILDPTVDSGFDSTVVVIQITNPAVLHQIVEFEQSAQFYKQFSNRLVDIFGNNAKYAKTGDNEFAVFSFESLSAASYFDWDKIRLELMKGFSANDKVFSPEVVIGISSENNDEKDTNTRLIDARLAILHDSNDSGVSSFSSEMRTKSEEENRMVEEIRQAISHAEFVPFYQLKFDATTETPCGMEALCRWQKSDGSLVSPGLFIPVAESSGLIVDLTWSLLEQICRDIDSWQKEGLLPGPVAFNAAAPCLQAPDFVSRILGLCKPVTLQPGKPPVEIEVTENVALMDDSAFYDEMLAQLRQEGFRIALDDFGTGHASLSSVIGIDIDVLKIDQSFVRGMSRDSTNKVVVETVANIAKVKGVSCVAEGVESQEEARILASFGCTQLQGFHYHKPSNFNDVSQWLRDDNQLARAA